MGVCVCVCVFVLVLELALAYKSFKGARPNLPNNLPVRKLHLPAIFLATSGDTSLALRCLSICRHIVLTRCGHGLRTKLSAAYFQGRLPSQLVRQFSSDQAFIYLLYKGLGRDLSLDDLRPLVGRFLHSVLP